MEYEIPDRILLYCIHSSDFSEPIPSILRRMGSSSTYFSWNYSGNILPRLGYYYPLIRKAKSVCYTYMYCKLRLGVSLNSMRRNLILIEEYPAPENTFEVYEYDF
ncbi:MAG: hypothetical protein FGF52_02655 [Candidatus Brockarchaeota archaeon]|nr:hypothetical protein [Candidatus Brockarchaeota archaeon]